MCIRDSRYVDVLIPRGGAGLIRAVVENSTIPVIETGTGNCHIYVDETADLSMAVDIILNAKTQRVGVCNACESIVVHENVREKLLPVLEERLKEKHVEMRADEKAREYMPEAEEATEEDWGKEYLDYKISIKTVDNIDEAIAHIAKYSTGHSESIITENYLNAQKFLNEVDSAAVYVNASTRFTDGGEFGLAFAQGRQQRGQNVADGVAAGLAEDCGRAALKVGQHRHADGRQRDKDHLTGRAPDGAEHRARHVDGEQSQIDGYAPGHRDSDLAANGNQRGKHGAKHHAADIVSSFRHTFVLLLLNGNL